jgi:hypothetical protein
VLGGTVHGSSAASHATEAEPAEPDEPPALEEPAIERLPASPPFDELDVEHAATAATLAPTVTSKRERSR